MRTWLKKLDRFELVLVGIFLLTMPLVNPYIRSDGNEYYAYIRSLVIDGDLHFENEYRRGDPLFQGAAFDKSGKPIRATYEDGTLGMLDNGYMKNRASVGASILWTPFFLAAHLLVQLLNGFGAEIVADGYSLPYRWLCAFGTAMYGFLALFLAYRICARLTNPRVALMTTIGLWFASPIPVYLYFLPFSIPVLSMFSTTLFVWYWLRTQDTRTPLQWAFWGLIGGLMLDVYYFGSFFILIAMGEMIRAIRRDRQAIVHSLLFLGATLVAMIPTFWIKAILTGSPFKSGYGEKFYWLAPKLWQLGFSTEHGQFLWTPILLFAVIGLALLYRRNRLLAGALLAVYGVAYYVIASYEFWSGFSSFGSRFFVAFNVAFAIGLAIVLDRAETWLSKFSRREITLLLSAALGVLILWNVGFIFQWGTNMINNRGPVDFRVVAKNQFTSVPDRIFVFLTNFLVNREKTTSEIEMQDIEKWKLHEEQRRQKK